ncbi:hypothetical protein [Enterococcus faecalis]|uniref:hypothetical protein n=2 Tax=Enterococcus TaxID=1350 RepID=UPI0021AD69E4
MQLAMQGILVLNETTVKSNGLYTLPSGVDKSYFTEIKKDTKNEVTDKQLLEGCTIIRVHDRSRGFEYYMLEKDDNNNSREKGLSMLKIVNKKFNLITIFSIALLVMGFLIVGLQLYFYFIYGSKFLDSITLIGMIDFGLGYYQLFLKKGKNISE